MDEQTYWQKVSEINDFAFELYRVTGKLSIHRVELDDDELKEFELAHQILDKLSERVLRTDEQLDQYDQEWRENEEAKRREYWSARGICSGPLGGNK